MNARVAFIEEVSSDEKDNEDEEIPFLAARTAQLSEEQRETLLEEIQDINANFKGPTANGDAKGHIPRSHLHS